MAKRSTESPRLKTGIPGFDELLGGGLLCGRSALIKGPPGSAKTTFGMQTLVNGALDYGEAGIYLTFEQLPAQLLADAAGFGWDLQALADDHLLKVLFITPEEVLQNPGRQENNLLVRIADWVEETGAKRLLIDSISHMRELYVGVEARASLLNFLLRLKGLGLTPILTAERTESDSHTDVDVYLVDTVIYLDYETGGLGRPDRRTLEIIKTRGHRHVAGAHPFEIGEGGVTVYPHTYRMTESTADAADGARLPTGIRSLDARLDGG